MKGIRDSFSLSLKVRLKNLEVASEGGSILKLHA